MKVTTLPVILISIPFGMIISLHVGSFLRDLGAEAHMGAAMFWRSCARKPRWPPPY